MAARNRARFWIKIFAIVLFLSMISSHGGLFDFGIHGDPAGRSTRSPEELEWIQTTQEDFENGTIGGINNATGLEIIPSGEIILDTHWIKLQDKFKDESKIGYNENIEIDTSAGEAALLKSIRLFSQGDNDDGRSVVQTSDGGFIITGNTGTRKLWIIKTDEDLNEQWNRTFGFEGSGDFGSSVQETSDGGLIITGHTDSYGAGSSDMWLIKLNESGAEEWNNTYGGVWGDGGSSVKQTDDNGFIVTGNTQSFGNGSMNNESVWLLKTDEFGNEEWNRTYTETDHGRGSDIVITSDLGYMIIVTNHPTGPYFRSLLIKTDSFGNEQWRKIFGGAESDISHSIKRTSDGGYITAGYTQSFGSGGWDMWLVKFDTSGNEQWNRTFGAADDDYGEEVVQTIDGGYAVTGYTRSYGTGEADVWLVKTDEDGYEIWNRTYGEYYGTDTGRSLDFCSDGGFVIVGNTESYPSGNDEVLLIKTNELGLINGTLISTNMLAGQNSLTIDWFEFDVEVIPTDILRVQFSQNGEDWYNSSGYLNEWDRLWEPEHYINLSPLGWSGSDFYYRIEFISNSVTRTPKVDYCRITFDRYFSEGIFISEEFDSNTFPYWKILNWSATLPQGTDIKFQIQTSDDQGFVGPNGSSESYYTISGQSIWEGHERDRWIQYKAYLTTTNQSITPVLEEVKITYEPIDTDGDGIEDFIDTDDDNDDMPDMWETTYDLDPLNQSDAQLDPDFDGLTNVQEYFNNSYPNEDDTDGDNLGDGFEVIFSKTKPDNWDTNNNSIGDGLEFINSQGYLGWIGSLPDDWIGMTISWDNYTIFVKTNSSVLEGEFDKEEQKLKIKVSGPDGTMGVTEMDIPKGLCDPDDIEIELDGELIEYILTENTTHYHIYIEYNHSIHIISADFARIVQEITDNEDEGLPLQYLIAIVFIVVLVALIAIGITRFRNGFQNNEIPDIPPEELSKMLEEKYSGGEMTDETYKDIKSILKKYEDGEGKQ